MLLVYRSIKWHTDHIAKIISYKFFCLNSDHFYIVNKATDSWFFAFLKTNVENKKYS